MTWWLAILFKPLFSLFFMLCLVLPIKILLLKIIPDGYVKDVLLVKLNGDRK